MSYGTPTGLENRLIPFFLMGYPTTFITSLSSTDSRTVVNKIVFKVCVFKQADWNNLVLGGKFNTSIFVFVGWPLTVEQLEEVATLSDVLSKNDDYLPQNFREKCEQVIADPLALDLKDISYAFRYLKNNIQL